MMFMDLFLCVMLGDVYEEECDALCACIEYGCFISQIFVSIE
jgi:hypothetical protein